MTCETIRPQLVGFHFGIADDRASIEDHLLECKSCLREALDLKRAIELGEDAPRPSDASRAKLRAAVQTIIAPPPVKRRPWERPVAVAFAASAVLLSIIAMHSLTAGPGEAPYVQRERQQSVEMPSSR